jgi:hypothetical protein
VPGLGGDVTVPERPTSSGPPSALFLALLAQARQPVCYASGRLVAAMSGAHCGEGSTDREDAFVMAETARLRVICLLFITRAI